ncbi:uncharacterized protein BKA78DRAFT_159192 [Phyllosticta capitalensis]|uniref:uncharacterized protein n=1 Tax=Phyllosticta capitalensis TaxID=121624 RepID=UPI003131CAB0
MHSVFGVCSARAQPASQSASSLCVRKRPEWTDRFCSTVPTSTYLVNQSVRRSSRQVVTVHRFHPFTHTSAMFCPAMRCVVIRVVHREVRRVGLGSGDPEAWRGGGGATTTTTSTTTQTTTTHARRHAPSNARSRCTNAPVSCSLPYSCLPGWRRRGVIVRGFAAFLAVSSCPRGGRNVVARKRLWSNDGEGLAGQ